MVHLRRLTSVPLVARTPPAPIHCAYSQHCGCNAFQCLTHIPRLPHLALYRKQQLRSVPGLQILQGVHKVADAAAGKALCKTSARGSEMVQGAPWWCGLGSVRRMMAKAGPATTCGCTPNVKLWVIIHCSKAAGCWYISMHMLYCGAGSHRLRKGFPAGVCGATDGSDVRRSAEF